MMTVFTAETSKWLHISYLNDVHRPSETLRAIQICTVQLSHGDLLQRRFAASAVNTCFAGVPLTGRSVEGREGVQVMFNVWSVFVGNFALYRVVTC